MKSNGIRKLIGILAVVVPGVAIAQNDGQPAEPAPKRVIEPLVPSELRGMEAEVNVRFRIDQSGKVRDLQVVESTTNEHARSVANAVRKWEFQPQNRDQVVLLPVRFLANK